MRLRQPVSGKGISCSLCSKGDYRIDTGGAAGREIAGDEAAKREQDGDRESYEGVEAVKSVNEERGEELT
jgi:hypothetical protein